MPAGLSLADEISEFVQRYAQNGKDLPYYINLAFSIDRRSEAWHARLDNGQAMRGFHRSAPITMMLSLKLWRDLMKKNKIALWDEAVSSGQISIHGDETAIVAMRDLFNVNGRPNDASPEN